MGKITKQQLSDGLLEYIASNKGSNIAFEKKSVVIPDATNRVAIGIQGYNKKTDLLMVYKNTVYLEEGRMYSISEDSQYIISPSGNWDANTLFNFIVIKNSSSGNNGNNNIPNSGNGNFEIVDGSITEAKLDQDVKNKLNEVNTLKEKVRYKKDSITEADLDQNVKNKLNNISNSGGNTTFEIADGSITELKLDQNVKNKLNEVTTLKNTVRYKNQTIGEVDLDQNLKEKLNIAGAKTWSSLKNDFAKTWANLMGN